MCLVEYMKKKPHTRIEIYTKQSIIVICLISSINLLQWRQVAHAKEKKTHT